MNVDIYNKSIISFEDKKLISHIPEHYLTQKKIDNFILSRNEEVEKRKILSSKPYHIVLEPNNSCNLKCPLCSTGIGQSNRKKGKLSLQNFKKIIDIIADETIELYLQNWGESTLLPYFPEMISYASSKNIWTSLSTNLSINYKNRNRYLERLIESGLSHIIVDIDGASQDVYEKYRVKGELSLVLDNVKRLVKIKSELGIEEPIIEARMLVMRHNEHQIPEFIKLAESLGVDKISTGAIQVNPNESMDWLPENDKYVYPTYSRTNGSLTVLPSDTKKQCHWLWSGLVINYDGGISPCCIVDDKKADFGNIIDQDILDIWNNNKYQTARSEFVSELQVDNLTICNECKNNTHDANLNRVGNSFSIMML